MKGGKTAALFGTLDKKKSVTNFMKFVFKLGRSPLSDASGTAVLLLTLITKCNVAKIKTIILVARED
jgi:hypothetical protein